MAKIVIPPCQTDHAIPCPELTFEATRKELSCIVYALQRVKRNGLSICNQLFDFRRYESNNDAANAIDIITNAIAEAIAPSQRCTIIAYCIQGKEWETFGSLHRTVKTEAHIKLRSTWLDHMERCIWEQLES